MMLSLLTMCFTEWIHDSDYKTLAEATGFIQIPNIRSDDTFPECKNFDEFVDSMHVWRPSRRI